VDTEITHGLELGRGQSPGLGEDVSEVPSGGDVDALANALGCVLETDIDVLGAAAAADNTCMRACLRGTTRRRCRRSTSLSTRRLRSFSIWNSSVSGQLPPSRFFEFTGLEALPLGPLGRQLMTFIRSSAQSATVTSWTIQWNTVQAYLRHGTYLKGHIRKNYRLQIP
jgi:hypothetical protein